MRIMNITTTWEYEAENSPVGPAMLTFEVEADFTPGEREVRYYADGSGYPGSPPEIEVTAMRLKKIDWFEGDALCAAEVADQYSAVNEWAMGQLADNDHLCDKLLEAANEDRS